MAGKPSSAFFPGCRSAMRKKDGPVITRKEDLGLRQTRDYYFRTAYAANSSGHGGIPEDTRTARSCSAHPSGHGNIRNLNPCTESTPQKNGQNTSSNAGRTLSRQARSFTGTNHSLSTPRKNWTGWSGSCTEDFSTDSAKACSYYGDTGWNGRNSPHGNGTC